MTPANCKKLLEMGILQAYAEGKVIQFTPPWETNWKDDKEYDFDANPYQYRIKPEPTFKVGGLVRTPTGQIGRVFEYSEDCRTYDIRYLSDNSGHLQLGHNLTKVKEIRTSFTFEQAVKAVAEHGFDVRDPLGYPLTLTDICKNEVTVTPQSGPNKNKLYAFPYVSLTDHSFLDGTPFCNITYEDVT